MSSHLWEKKRTDESTLGRVVARSDHHGTHVGATGIYDLRAAEESVDLVNIGCVQRVCLRAMARKWRFADLVSIRVWPKDYTWNKRRE